MLSCPIQSGARDPGSRGEFCTGACARQIGRYSPNPAANLAGLSAPLRAEKDRNDAVFFVRFFAWQYQTVLTLRDFCLVSDGFIAGCGTSKVGRHNRAEMCQQNLAESALVPFVRS